VKRLEQTIIPGIDIALARRAWLIAEQEWTIIEAKLALKMWPDQAGLFSLNAIYFGRYMYCLTQLRRTRLLREN
jgi:hypothetical protein